MCGHVGSLPSHASAPLFKKVPMWHPHHNSEPWPGSLHTPLSKKNKKSFSVSAGRSLPLPPTVLGARVSLLDSPGWCCSYGCADVLLAVCAASLPVSYNLPSLSQLELGSSLCGTRARSRRGGNHQAALFLLCSLCFRQETHLKQGVSPATCKYRMGQWKASSALLHFKSSYEPRFP